MGTPSQEFIRRLQPTVRNYIENIPHCRSYLFDELFPDSQFPPDSSDHHDVNGKFCCVHTLYTEKQICIVYGYVQTILETIFVWL